MTLRRFWRSRTGVEALAGLLPPKGSTPALHTRDDGADWSRSRGFSRVPGRSRDSARLADVLFVNFQQQILDEPDERAEALIAQVARRAEFGNGDARDALGPCGVKEAQYKRRGQTEGQGMRKCGEMGGIEHIAIQVDEYLLRLGAGLADSAQGRLGIRRQLGGGEGPLKVLRRVLRPQKQLAMAHIDQRRQRPGTVQQVIAV